MNKVLPLEEYIECTLLNRVTANGVPLDVDEQGLTVTISIGGTLVLPEDTPELLVQRADVLMYRSKQAGRNCVTVG